MNKIIAGWRQYNVPTISLPFASAGEAGFHYYHLTTSHQFPAKKISPPLALSPANFALMSEDEKQDAFPEVMDIVWHPRRTMADDIDTF